MLYTIFLSLLAGGCSLLSHTSNTINEPFAGSPTGRLVNKKAFIAQGTLAVLPFKAGEGAVADPQFDRISLMISKGIIDYLNEQHLPFELLSTQGQGSPQMLMEGYIERFKKPGRFKKFFFGSKRTLISVSGQVIVVDSKERILVFKHSKTKTDPTKNELDLAYQTGQDLGQFIVEALIEE